MPDLDNSLIKLNFAPGIKAKDINYNFDIVKGWVDRERRRVGGPGLVNGFELSADTQAFTVTVGSGTMVTKDGEEVYVPAKTFYVGPPEYTPYTEKIVCPTDGVITLSEYPYSPSKVGYIDYSKEVNGTDALPATSEFDIHCDENGYRVYYTQITGKKIFTSSPEAFLDKTLTFKYYAAQDRVDAIILYPDGTYKYQKSIISDSPSHVNIDDYPKDCMMVGVIHWMLSTRLDVEFYTNHRSYRNVYVDDNRTLYLDGKPYKPSKFIYFVEPEDPQEDDLYYDRDSNSLLIWRKCGGDWGWVMVNDTSNVVIRDVKMWDPNDTKTWPEDSQTFLFADDEVNFKFVPNTNSVSVIIDNMPLMSDQFEEVVSEINPDAPEYTAQGIGIKLKDPLDRATYVQVVVEHQVRSKPVRETFQRAAIFIDENHAIKQDVNKNQIFVTDYPYVVGANQLEVWVDGIRLVPKKDFSEIVPASEGVSNKEEIIAEKVANGELSAGTTINTDNTESNVTYVDEKKLFVATNDDMKRKNIMSTYFKINVPVNSGQLVEYKISRYVWDYDQLAQLVGDLPGRVSNLENDQKAMRTDLSLSNANVSKRINEISSKIDDLKSETAGKNDTSIKEASISIKHLNAEARSHMIGGLIDKTMPATAMESISGVTSKDFIQVFVVSSSHENRILIKNVDYIVHDTSNGLQIMLNPEHRLEGNTIYVTGFQLGV